MPRYSSLTAAYVILSITGCSAQPPATSPQPAAPRVAEKPKSVAEQAAEYEKASELGHPRSWVLKHGSKHAADWKAKAEKGDADAALLYSAALDCGAGVVPDRREGTAWLKKAAEGAQPYAMLLWGFAHYEHPPRIGVNWDRDAGFKWIKQSIEAGCGEAKRAWVALLKANYGPAFRDAFELEVVMKEFAEVESNRLVAKAADTADKLEAVKPVIVERMAQTVIANQLKLNSPKMMHQVVSLHQSEALGFAKNDEAVRALLTKAAEQQSTDSCLVLGDAHLSGKYGFAHDAAEAVTWFDRAVAVGGCDARVAVAKIYLDQPKGIDKPLEKALALLEAAAAEGDLEATRTLGKEHGPAGRLSKDNRKGVGYYRRLADLGDTTGMVALARRIVLEPPADPAERKNREGESTHWLEKAAARDNAAAMVELFTRHTTGKYAEKDEKKGLIFLRDAARLKDGKALYRLAEVCAKGQFGSPEDGRSAEKFLREGINAGSTDCMFQLGFTTFRTTTSLDFTAENSGYWMMRQAADLGHAEAQYQVGLSHMKRDGSDRGSVERDVNDLMSRPTGEFRLKGFFEESSESIRGKRGEDPKAARAWLERAAKQGHAKAKAALAELK